MRSFPSQGLTLNVSYNVSSNASHGVLHSVLVILAPMRPIDEKATEKANGATS